MKPSIFEMVMDFHKAFGAAIDQPFESNLLDLRCDLMEEELKEVTLEMFDVGQKGPDPKALTKELADLLYVTIGTAITFGLPLEEVFREVHKSNMSKLTKEGYVLRREDGKVLKSDQYKEPNLDKYFK
jgi:predicted HAD superfamily Cof-like phosphohydrolase